MVGAKIGDVSVWLMGITNPSRSRSIGKVTNYIDTLPNSFATPRHRGLSALKLFPSGPGTLPAGSFLLPPRFALFPAGYHLRVI